MAEKTFTLNEAEVVRAKKWLVEHALKCRYLWPHRRVEEHTRPYHFIFTESSVCDRKRIQCDCGEEADIGDPD
jgi:hypothetical protein